MKRLALIPTLILGVLLMLGARPTEAEDIVDLIPDQAEIILRLDAEAFIDSEPFNKLLDAYGREKAMNQIEVIKNLTDLDPLEDFEEVFLMGKVEEDESLIFVARGEFNEEKLVSLVRLNESYEKIAYGDSRTKGHYWEDGSEEKHAVFLPDGIVAIANSRESMEALIATREGNNRSFAETDAGKSLPRNIDSHVFWGMLINTPDIDGEFGEFAKAVDMAYLLATVDFDDNEVTTRLLAHPEDDSLVDDYIRIGEGGHSIAKLLREEEPLARLLFEELRVREAENGLGVEATMTLTSQEFFDFLEDHGAEILD